MLKRFLVLTASAVVLAAQGHAGTITGYIFTDQEAVSNDATLGQFAALGGATAANAIIHFNGTANFTATNGDSTNFTIDQFLATGGVAPIGGTVGSHALDNTYFYFTGTVGLQAGANDFTVTHDDGLQLNIDGIGLVVDTPGPTGPTPTPYVVNAPAAGNYTFELAYGECCGGEAQITVYGGTLQTVPEAGSLALLGAGFGALGFGLRRRAR